MVYTNHHILRESFPQAFLKSVLLLFHSPKQYYPSLSSLTDTCPFKKHFIFEAIGRVDRLYAQENLLAGEDTGVGDHF